jgi:hypothetical protein
MLFAQAAFAAPATQPAAPLPATRQAPATAPAGAKAPPAQRIIDPRWRQINEATRTNSRRWADAPIVQTLDLDALIRFTLDNDSIRAETTQLPTAAPIRIAVRESKSVWMLRRNQGAINADVRARGFGAFTQIDRFDFDARDDEFWSGHASVGENLLNLSAQSMYGITTIRQNATGVTIQAVEYGQWGQPQKKLCSAQSRSMLQFRVDHPEDFRMYVVPVLARFSDMSFLIPGPADVYSVFTEIRPDETIVQRVALILPQLDADDPDDREAGSAKLRQLGVPAVIAALRWDDAELSAEQKSRLESFVDAYRRRSGADPALRRRDLNFLIDSLEYNDPAVKAAARAELEKQTGQPIIFDTRLTGGEAAKAGDALRGQLLSPPPATQPAGPATQPGPQT